MNLDSPPFLDKAVMLKLAKAAVWAPSADNSFPFRLEIEDGRLLVFAAERFSEADDSRKVLDCIGLGASIENIAVIASENGLVIETDWAARFPASELLVSIRIKSVGCDTDPLASAVSMRCTNRRLFSYPGLSADLREELSKQMPTDSSTNWLWLDQRRQRLRLCMIGMLAEAQRFSSEPLHKELFGSIRWDVGWSNSASEGIPPAATELPAMERQFFALLRHWPLARGLALIGGHRLVAFRAVSLPLLLAPNICVITTKRHDMFGFIAAGRTMQRLWLYATAKGFSVQPYAAPPLYAHVRFPGLSSAIQLRLRAKWVELVGDSLPVMLLRIGSARPPSVRSQRLPVENYLRGDSAT
jgi:hypothetical protein